jgi:ParB family transcriptional regulator, chromosome partitioning protein
VPEKRPALGRGLSALIPDVPAVAPAASPSQDTPTEVELDLLTRNPFQPRMDFDQRRLGELAESIRVNGIIQPITVRRAPETSNHRGKYEIIAGERRWRAAQLARLLRVPVIIKEVPDEKLLELALIENIQREDLNPMDQAHAYHRLTEEFHLTQDDIANAVGKDRTSVANHMRLLKLPPDVKQHVASGALSMGHARALLAIEPPAMLLRAARQVIDGKLSVRETEVYARKVINAASTVPKVPPPARNDPNTLAAQDQLRLALGTRVRIIRKGRQGGRVEIDFVSEDELNRIYEYIIERR